jgi:hypothetical protein
MRQIPGRDNLVHCRVDASDFTEGMIRITKGLLHQLHPRLDYQSSSFDVVYISPQSSDEQLKVIECLTSGTRFERGDGVFKSWRRVDEVKCWGAWMLIFYDCFGYIVSHTNGPEIDIMRERLKADFASKSK